MSHVTNIIITLPLMHWDEGCPPMEKINQKLHEKMGSVYHTFKSIQGHEGGTKGLECEIWIAALNHLDLAWFKLILDDVNWDEGSIGTEIRDNVRVYVMDEHDDHFDQFWPTVAKQQ